MDKISSNDIIRKYKIIIDKYKNLQYIKDMKKSNYKQYEKHMYNKFKEFKLNFPIIFDMLISDKNNNLLETMMNHLDNIIDSDNIQDDINNIRYKLGNELHNTFVKDKLNNNNNNFEFIK